MLGALILQVMDKEDVESLKVMIFLIEGCLPPGYFNGSLGKYDIKSLLNLWIIATKRFLHHTHFPTNNNIIHEIVQTVEISTSP